MRGFSLVELSIVLVILGLLTGGILAGQSLIRAAELRSVSRSFEQFHSSIMTFRDKYFFLPGDITNATSFWGTATNCPGAFNQPSTDARTCNGDGDGKVEYFGVATAHEHHRIWQHLANAGLLEGSYTGVPADASDVRTFSTLNAPQGKLSNSIIQMSSFGDRTSADTFWWAGNYDNQFFYAALSGFVTQVMLLPEEAWNIDTKIDDGKPALGKLRTPRKNGDANCTTTNVEATTEYLLTYGSAACRLQFLPLK